MTDQKKEIAELLSGMIDGLETGDIESMIEIPPESKLGDYAFPCFKLAKTMRKAPNLIAQELAGKTGGRQYVFRGEKRQRICEFFPEQSGSSGRCRF